MILRDSLLKLGKTRRCIITIMKLTIITVCYNSAKTVEDTLKSVVDQSYTDIEYIVIDGGSTDGTLGIINRYAHKIAKVVSEKDNGMYDAMNKGIKLATGDIIGILNSDDFYASNDVIETVVDRFEQSNVECLWGDLSIIDRSDSDKVIRNWKSAPYVAGSFQKGWHPPHTTFFVRKDVYRKHGLFRTDLSTYADYELMLRLLVKNAVTSSYIPKVLTRMRAGGSSSKSLFNWIRGNIGSYRAFQLNGLKISAFFIFRKPLGKLGQFIRSW